MAPIGYVGVSPKCILGVNKNHGEEISLRLRTDDLKGFRKYQSIKKTLLHELAHMVFSEHDSNFYAMDKQLNEEAATLDWTKSRGHTLSGVAHSQRYEDEFDISSNVSSQKLGGQASFLPHAHAASVNAAFERLANSYTTVSRSSEVEGIGSQDTDGVQELTALPTPTVHGNQNVPEPDPDDSKDGKSTLVEPYVESEGNRVNIEMNPHHVEGALPALETPRGGQSNTDNSRASLIGPNSNREVEGEVASLERELDDSVEDSNSVRSQNTVQPNQMDFLKPTSTELTGHVHSPADEPQPSDSHAVEIQSEPDSVEAMPKSQTVEPDPDDPELQIIQDPVTMFCSRLQSAIQSLKYEVKPSETGMVLQTLTKIIRNIIEHPEDMKFKKLRKANPMIQRNIIAHKAAMDILTLIGFCEDVIVDEWGKAEVFLMLKRNDPGLLWLAKSSLETHVV